MCEIGAPASASIVSPIVLMVDSFCHRDTTLGGGRGDVPRPVWSARGGGGWAESVGVWETDSNFLK